MTIRFNYSKLRGKIKEKYSTQESFANAVGISNSSLSLKLNNNGQFSQYEIEKLCNTLDIPKNQIVAYFFTTEVQ